MALLKAIKTNHSVTYGVTGWRLGRLWNTNVYENITITPEEKPSVIEFNGTTYSTLSITDKGESASDIGRDKTSYSILLICSPTGGFVPAIRTHDSNNIYARSITTPPDMTITGISFDADKIE